MKRRKMMAIILIALMIVSVVVKTDVTKADGERFVFTGDDGSKLTYKVISSEDKTVEMLESSGWVNDNLVVPSKVYNGDVEYTVVHIGGWSFDGMTCPDESITFPDTIRSVGPRAFDHNYNIDYVYMNEGLLSIEYDAFKFASALKSVVLPSTLTKIEHHAFGDCNSLESIVLPGSLTQVDNGAFESCDILKEVVILPGATGLAGDIFKDCPNPTVYVPNGSDYPSFESAAVVKYYPLTGSDTETQRKILLKPGKYPDSYKTNEFYFIGDDDPATFTVVPALTENENVADLFETENLAITDNGDGTYSFVMPACEVVAKTEIGLEAPPAEVAIDGWKFGEKANAPKLTEGSNPDKGEVTYTYYTDEKCTEETTKANGAATDGAVPTQAGKYYVKASVAKTELYLRRDAIASFTIEKAEAPSLPDVSTSQAFSKTTLNESCASMPKNAGTVTYSVGEAVTTGDAAVSGLAINGTDGTITAALSGGASGDTITIPVTVSSDNYEDASFAFVITLTDRGDAGVSLGADLSKVYGDEDFALTAKFEDAGEGTGVRTWKSSNEDVAVVDQDGNVMLLASGETEITLNYVSDTTEGSASVKLTVAPRDLSGADVSVDGYYEFDTTEQIPEDPDITVTINGLSLVNGTDYTVTVTDNVNAGEATVTVTGMGNYKGTALGSFVIEKAQNPLDLEYDVYVLQGGNTADLNESIYDAVGKVTFAIDNDTSDGCTLDEQGVITTGATTGQCTVIVTVAETENYLGAQETLIVWVTDKEPQEISFEETEVSKTYGDPAFAVAVKGALTKVSYAVTEGEGVVSVAADGTVEILGAGTAVITATAEETLEYAPDTAKIKIVVAQADLPYTVPTGLTGVYGQKLSTIALPKDANGTWAWESSEDGTGDAGTHTFLASFTPKDTENYNTITGISVSVTIVKADIDPADVTAPEAVEGCIYDGTEQSLIIAGFAPNGTMLYALTKDGEDAPSEDVYAEAIPGATEAGTYVVYYRVAGDANHNDIEAKSLTVKIAEPDPVYYTVKFADQDGNVLSEQTVLEGEKAVRPEDPAKEGNSFDGWFADAQFATAYDFDQAVNADTVVYARFASTEYYVVYGDGMGSYILNEGEATDLVVTIKVKGGEDRSFYHFKGVKINGEALGDDAYEVREGSTIVTIPGSLFASLSDGDHYVLVEFDNGSAEAIVKVEAKPEPEPEKIESPKTGDESLNLWIVMAIVAVMGSVAAVILEKKANES